MGRLLALLLLSLAVASPARAAVNQDAGSIQVWTNNVENLDPCSGGPQKLIDAMKERVPDVFLVQQLSGAQQLASYTKTLTDSLAGTFAGTIADVDPREQDSSCGDKAKQTNAIIWRTTRVRPIDSVRPKGTFPCPRAQSKGLCFESLKAVKGGCAPNPQSRSRNLMVHFRDRKSGKAFTAVSIHWPSGRAGKPDQETLPNRDACAKRNARTAKRVAAANGDPIRFFGGDFNYTPAGWYGVATKGFGDAQPSGGDDRRDYLFAQRGDGTAAPFPEADTLADTPYAAHDAIFARIGY